MSLASPLKSPAIGLQAVDLAFGYGRGLLLDGLDFTIPQGEIHALLGRSGVGKTTLLNLMLGLYRPRRGKVMAAGEAITGPGRIRGAVFREDSLLGWLTVEENLLFPHHKAPNRVVQQRAQELLAAAGLSAVAAYFPKQLSAGMAKRVELLRAWLMDQSYFIGDEPFAALDGITRETLHQIWLRLRSEQPRTGILCTHDLIEAVQLCEAVMVMRALEGGGVTIVTLRPPERMRIGADRMEADPFLRQITELLQ